MRNFFEDVTQLPPDPIFGVVKSFLEDKREGKIDAIAGTYRGEDLQPYLFPSVKKAEEALLARESSKEYLPIDGDQEYIEATKELLFGTAKQLPPLYGAQTVGGTGALHIAGRFLKETLGFKKLYLGLPTWANHRRIFENAHLQVESFPYYSKELRGVDFAALCQNIEKMEKRSVLLMQPCCHNPTGCDLTQQQWRELFAIGKKRELFFLLDLAYQGFGEGLQKDVEPLSLFLESGMQGAIAVSHSKTFGLYAERVGALFLVCHTEEQKKAIGSQICALIRGIYSNPPCHGARVICHLLKNSALKKQWEEELSEARGRIATIRNYLATELQMDFLRKQKGMFAFMGLESALVQKLKERFALYLPGDGRINAAGINLDVAKAIVRAIHHAEKEK